MNFYPGANGWQHLVESRYSDLNQNFALQIGGSLFDQDLWFRKTNNGNPMWSQLIGAGPRNCTAPFNSMSVTSATNVSGIARSNTLCATTRLAPLNFQDAQEVCFALGGHVATYGETYLLAKAHGPAVLHLGDWIGNRVGDDLALTVNSTSNLFNFEGVANKSDVRQYRCAQANTLVE